VDWGYLIKLSKRGEGKKAKRKDVRKKFKEGLRDNLGKKKNECRTGDQKERRYSVLDRRIVNPKKGGERALPPRKTREEKEARSA